MAENRNFESFGLENGNQAGRLVLGWHQQLPVGVEALHYLISKRATWT